MTTRYFPLALCITLLSFTLVGCDLTSDDDTPPELIPEAAFTLQTDLFQNDGNKTETRAHFTAGALRVWPVSTIISVHLITPVAVTVAALQDDQPEFRNGVWEWSTSTIINGQDVEFTLRGDPEGSRVDWSMFITASNLLGVTYDEFELYTAQTDVSAQTGSWQLFYRLNGTRTNVLNADFAINGDNAKEITYSIPSAQPHGGTAVTYETDGDDRSFFWDQVTEGFLHDVAWDAATQAGSITATNYNGGEQGCWDENLDDVDC